MREVWIQREMSYGTIVSHGPGGYWIKLDGRDDVKWYRVADVERFGKDPK